jgi:HPt (histidine-containing phosphotransfer) domain-containing protein
MADILDFPLTVVGETASPPLAPDAQPIDRSHLFRMTLGDHALECEVLRLFDQQASMLLARMGEADPARVAALAHTLQGSARGIGAWGVARAAEVVEVAASAEKGDELQSAIDALAVTAGEAQRAIAELLRV